MNETNRSVTATTKPASTPATPTPLQCPAGLPKATPQAEPAEAKSQPAHTQAPRRTVRFEVSALKALSVSVVGTFNDWKIGATPLSSLGGGKWVKELSLARGRHEYRFVVDGKWVDPPHAKAYVPNPYGGRNAMVEI